MSFAAAALTGPKPEQYHAFNQQLAALIGDERDFVANMANMAALIFHQLPDLNWAGFYLMRGQELVLGPFQGKPACIRIPLGRGVCGTAAATRETQVVPDVHAFPGHIACDADSRSEIVVPLIHDGAIIGVLDLDSPRPGRFDEDDRAGLEAAAGLLVQASLPS
ncbi:GAF domain-containing protein [Sandarakinorhabdus sp.]|uniref:GAF domain-containing protein n=1 Tax=Sandarakinorhabdus sp. TaxID=1916663 RepID=UPI0033405031